MRVQVSFICVLLVALEVNGYVRNRNVMRLTPIDRPDGESPISGFTVDQPVDHFKEESTNSDDDDSESSENTQDFWTQRGWSSNEFADYTDAPVFLMIDGEHPSEESSLHGGAMYDLAKKYKAWMFVIEHRYYGESQPTDDVSTDNLQYLTTNQALEDIKTFIKEVNKDNKFTNENKWILFGGGYAGNLAAWARVQFPEQVYGAISSSPPLQAKADFSEYNDAVRESLNSLFPGCGDTIAQAVKDIQAMFADDAGAKKFLDAGKYCQDSFDRQDYQDVGLLFDGISDDIGKAVEGSDETDLKMEDVCKKYMLNNATGTPVDRLAALLSRNKTECEPLDYEAELGAWQETDWKSNTASHGSRQWMYQTCSEYGFFKTSASKNSLYSDTIPMRYYTQQCIDIFGDKLNENNLLENVDDINKKFHGTDIKATNVVFVQGSLDPWKTLGMVKKPTDNDPLIVINGTSNCDDMNAADPKDSPALQAARSKIDDNIKEWLKE